MSNELTFPTEAARLAARKQYVALGVAIHGNHPAYLAEAFNRAFPPIAPPIAPPKMVSWKGWCPVWEANGLATSGAVFERPNGLLTGERLARVRVTEVTE